MAQRKKKIEVMKKQNEKDLENMTYEEVHQQLVEAFQDAFSSDEAGPYQAPEIDYSFMDMTPEELRKYEEELKKKL